MVSYLNMISPSTLPDSMAEAVIAQIAHNLHAGPRNVALVQMPQHTYKKGQLWIAEHALLRNLAGLGLEVDQQYQLQFSARHDPRDARPLSFPGRILKATASEWGPWGNTPLLRAGRTALATQLPASKMRVPEDLSPFAVPQSTDLDAAGPQGAQRWQQLGVDAMLKLLDSVLDDSKFQDQNCLNHPCPHLHAPPALPLAKPLLPSQAPKPPTTHPHSRARPLQSWGWAGGLGDPYRNRRSCSSWTCRCRWGTWPARS